jgi:ProP effector
MTGTIGAPDWLVLPMSTDTLPNPASTSDAPPAPAARPAPADTAATAAQLKQLFPGLFAGAPKPIKLRIQNDIQERAPGVFSKQALSAFFRRYTGSTSYLIAVTRAKERFDLDGKPSGELSEEHRKIAADELARRRALHDERRELEEQQRRNRATLLRDFERTTLTPANFSALKGITLEELDRYLAQAREEAAERAQHAPQPPQQQARRLPRR